MNHIELVGRLTKDPDIRQTQSGTTVARFTVAVDRPRKNKETGQRETDFIDCVTFGFTADFLRQWFHKGDPIETSGTLRNNNYTDKNGVQHYSYNVYSDSVGFVPRSAKADTEDKIKPEDFAKDAESKGVTVKKNDDLKDLGDFEGLISDGGVPF